MKIRSLCAALALSAMLVTTGQASSYEELLKRGDRLGAENRNQEALLVFQEAGKIKEPDAGLLHRIARELSQMVSDATTVSEKRRLARESVDYAERAVALAPNDAAIRLSRAICYGRLALYESNPTKKIKYGKIVRTEAEKAAKLDPKNDLAWHVLGRWYFEVAKMNPALRTMARAIFGNIPADSLERSVEYLKKGRSLGAPRVLHEVELGRAYLSLGEIDKARSHLEAGLSLPSREKDDEELKSLAREALGKIPG